MKVKEYYDNWLKNNIDNETIKELISLFKDNEKSNLDKQKLLETLMYKSVDVIDIDAFTKIVEGSNLQRILDTFEDLFKKSLKEEDSFWMPLKKFNIRLEHLKVVFFIALIKTLRATEKKENSLNNSFKESTLSYEIAYMLENIITYKATIYGKMNIVKEDLKIKRVKQDLSVGSDEDLLDRRVKKEKKTQRKNKNEIVDIIKNEPSMFYDKKETEVMKTEYFDIYNHITPGGLQDFAAKIITIAESAKILTQAIYITALKKVEETKDKIAIKIPYRNLDIEVLNELIMAVVKDNSKFPMLLEPLEYKYTDKNNSKWKNYYGGYLMSEDKKVGDGVNKNDFCLLLTADNTMLIVDPTHLENINYLMKIKLRVSNKMLKEIFELEDEELKRETDINLKILNKKNDKLAREELNEKIRGQRFLYTLFLAEIYTNQEFYLIWAFDGRGRIYNINSPLFFQSEQIIRNLFILAEEESDSFKITEEKLLSLDFFEQLNYKLNKENTLIGVDATNSAYQILGGLLGAEMILEQTNVKGTKKNDLYNLILNNFKQKLDMDLMELLFKQYQEKWNKSSKIIGLKEESIKDIINRITRKIIKKPIMTLAYNQNAKNAANEVMKATLGYENIMLYPIFKKIVDIILECLFDLFPTFNLFQASIKKLATIISQRPKEETKKNIIKAKVANHTFMQAYVKNIIYEHNYHSRITKETKVMYLYGKSDTTDIPVNARALLPNFIHFIDSNIALDVINQCKNENIPILPVHDCFYTIPKYLDKIKEFYRKSYIEIVLKNDLIEVIFRENEVDMREHAPELYELLEKNKLNREELIKKCTNENILF